MENLTKDVILLELKKKEKEIKEKFFVKKLYLFGSYAKNTQNSKSDIDFLVEFKKDKNDYENELDLQVYLYNILKKDIGLCEKNRLNKDYEPYIMNNNLIEIY